MTKMKKRNALKTLAFWKIIFSLGLVFIACPASIVFAGITALDYYKHNCMLDFYGAICAGIILLFFWIPFGYITIKILLCTKCRRIK